MVYEVEFKSGGYEYDYDINALTGDIVKHSKEKNDDYTAVQTPSENQSQQSNDKNSSGSFSDNAQSQAEISADKAKEIALSHAAVAAADAAYIKAELDYDDGRLIYDIEFVAKNIEYEYEIDAGSGKIIDFDKETDD